MSLKQLPEENIIEILLSFDKINDLQNFAVLNNEIFNKIKNNELFWKKVASLKFPNQHKSNRYQSYRDFYQFLLTYPIKNIVVVNFLGGVRGYKPYYYFYLPNGRRIIFAGSNPGPRSEVSLYDLTSDKMIELEHMDNEIIKLKKWMNELLYYPIIQNLIINDIYNTVNIEDISFKNIDLISINQLYDLLMKYSNEDNNYTYDLMELKRLMK